MPRMTDEEVLEGSGWIMECQAPLEISLEDDPTSRATGYAAELIIETIRERTPQEPTDAKDD